MNKSESADIHTGIAWAIIFAFAAIIISIIAIGQRWPRTELSFDYLGLLVGILAFITTILIGWQIALAFISREKLRNIDEVISSKTNHAIHFNLFHLYLTQGQNAQELNQMTSALDYYFRCLDCIAKGDLEQYLVESIIGKIKDIQSNRSVKINPKDYGAYKENISNINCRNKDDIIKELATITDETQPCHVRTWISTETKSTKKTDLWH